MVEPRPRLTNAVGDLVLGSAHVYALRQVLLVGRKKNGLQLWLVTCYFLSLLLFQLMGAYFHLWAPAPEESDGWWLLYLGFGSAAPCFYGASLSLDIFGPTKSGRIVAPWLLLGFFYACLIKAKLDLAERWPLLPRSFAVEVPASVSQALRHMTWMPSALRHNGLTTYESLPLTLTFDGRGYARVPFDAVFDETFRFEKDLIAPFPCWRTDSLTLLMLCFGVFANATHFTICLINRHRHIRAKRNLLAHLAMKLALLTMPLACLLGGVHLGIDWMHCCAAPAMFLQAKSCIELIHEKQLTTAKQQDETENVTLKTTASSPKKKKKNGESQTNIRQRHQTNKNNNLRN